MIVFPVILQSFCDGKELFEEYLKAVKSQINDKTILIVDGSDITKDHTTKMEGMAKVRDGSTGEYKPGYHILDLAKKFKGKYSLKFTKKNGISADCQNLYYPNIVALQTE